MSGEAVYLRERHHLIRRFPYRVPTRGGYQGVQEGRRWNLLSSGGGWDIYFNTICQYWIQRVGLPRSHLASEPVAPIEGAGPHMNDEGAWSTAECAARPWSGDCSRTGGCAGDGEAVRIRRESGMVWSQLLLSPRPPSP